MPNILLYVSPEVSDQVKDFMPDLGPILRKTTAMVLGDINPGQVAVMAIPLIASDNATTMQIFCIGIFSPNREAALKRWAVAIATKWLNFADLNHIAWKNNVDVWPILVNGEWMEATDPYIISMSKRLI